MKAELPWKVYDYFNLTGGLNDGFDAASLADNEASSLLNVVLTTGGAVTKRSGFTDINSSALGASAIFTGLHFYKQADGDRFLVAAVSSGATDRYYKMDYGGSGPDGTWDDITGALVQAFGQDDQADFAVAQDQLVIEDGVATTEPDIWTGTGDATDLGGTPPDASMVEYHKQHLWVAGDAAATSRLYHSQLCNVSTSPTCIQNWTVATDNIEVETNDGQIIRALKSALDCLYVFKDASIWRVCGTDKDNFTLEQMVRGIGTLSNRSVEVINNQFIFMTGQGDVAVYDGGITVQIISSKIEGTLSELNQDRFDEAVATAFDDGTGDEDYYVSVSSTGSSQHDTILLYDTFHKAWTKFSGLSANALAPFEISTAQKAIMFGNYTGTASRYPNGTNDDGAAINAFYQSGQLRFPDIPFQKTFRLAQIFLNQESTGNNVTFRYNLDFETTGTDTTISLAGSGAEWDSAIFDTDTYADLTTVIGRVEIDRGDEFLQWRISNSNADEPFTMKGLRLYVEPTGRQGGIQ